MQHQLLKFWSKLFNVKLVAVRQKILGIFFQTFSNIKLKKIIELVRIIKEGLIGT